MFSTVFVSHGGGPMPVLGDPGHQELVSTLKEVTKKLPEKPSVIIVVSAHWETSGFEITGGFSPSLIYDYYGFPPESYQFRYDSPGEPDLAKRISAQLAEVGIDLKVNITRGYDHGMFIPLMMMYPEANIPVVQISLDQSLSPQKHWEFGEQLAKTLPDGALLIGSGFSFHNMRAFFSAKSPNINAIIHHFQAWLDETVTGANISLSEAKDRWNHWGDIEGGRYCHPREEHLIPLIVCHGAAQKQGQSTPFTALDVEARHFYW